MAGSGPAILNPSLIGVLALAIVARLPSFWEPRWSPDEGVLAATGWEMDKGQLLYVRVWDGAQPLANVWMAAVVGITRGWHPGMQIVLAIQVLVATACVWAIARRIGGAAAPTAAIFGVALGLPITTGDVQGAELIGLPLLLGGVLLGISGGPIRAVAGGALLVAAALCHPNDLLDALAVPWFAALSGRPLRALPLLAGGAAAAAVAALVLAVTGAWTAYLDLIGNERAVLVWANGGAELTPIALLIRLAPIAVALFAGVRIGLEQGTPAARLVGAWLPLATIGAVLNPLGYVHQALEMTAPLALLLGLWLRWALVLPALIAVVVAMQAAMLMPRAEMFLLGRWPLPDAQYGTAFGWDRLLTYERGWYDHVVGVTGWHDYADLFPDQPAEQEDLAGAMRVEGRLAVWGNLPWLYLESDRGPTGRFVAQDIAEQRLPGAITEAAGAIADERPEYVVVSAGPPRSLNTLLRQRYDRLRFLPGPWPVYGLHSG